MGQRQVNKRAAWIGAGAAAGCAAMAYAVRGKSSTLFGPSVYKGVSTRRAIALTFDDGPSESTPALLEILHRHGATATFFQCGANVRRLPQVALEVAVAGHEIGNHSDTHPYLFTVTGRRILNELMNAQETIERTTGIWPSLFRPPYGARWFGLREAQRRLGLLGVMWTTIGVDWKWTHDQVTAHLKRSAKNGAIFCLHDGRVLKPQPDIRVTLRAVERLLPMLIDKGYHFERVSDIICPTI
jgi:peptidoglycan/xylan/chitin deacetylase (PgdA/CDA1 family)